MKKMFLMAIMAAAASVGETSSVYTCQRQCESDYSTASCRSGHHKHFWINKEYLACTKKVNIDKENCKAACEQNPPF